MKNRNSLLIALVSLSLIATSIWAQDTKTKKSVEVLQGPATAKLGTIAKIELPEGYAFLDGKTTREMMKAAGEPTSGKELGFLRPTNGQWSAFFEFNDIGYVKDAEKEKLDADKLLQSYRDGTAAQNKDREAAGRPPIEIVGWEKKPSYDPETHNLTWAIRATTGGEPLLNYNTRLLGRKGVMEVVLVCDPADLPATLPTFNKLLTDYSFSSGESYAEYRPGDKIAKYGLAALVLGGAAVGAAKLGLLGPVILLFKKAWKLVVVAFVAVVGFFKKMFARLFGKKDEARMGD